jgi:DNA-binding LytR/AlgR family response regulator
MIESLIIEDDLIERLRLRSMLIDFGFTDVKVASSVQQARVLLEQTSPDILISDVFLQDGTVLDLLPTILQKTIPTIFVTASTDESIYQKIQQTEKQACGYLVKPFDKISLFSTIQLLLPQHNAAKVARNYLLVRDQKGQRKIKIEDISWLEASANYTVLVTATGKFVIKKSLRQTINEFGENFVRIHKKYGINIHHATQLRTDSIEILGQELPVSYACRKDFMAKWLSLHE